MATSLLALLDDIATVLDDVALLTKVAARKTAGVLGDDLALNAQQVAGVKADRELPVVWAVAKGSFRNKLILVPAALAISAYVPWAVTPLLMMGGAFLCYEGAEKLAHALRREKRKRPAPRIAPAAASSPPPIDPVAIDPLAIDAVASDSVAIDPVAFEEHKIKGAVRTDFVLSAEIIAITLGTVATASFPAQVAVLAGVAMIMTVGVYGVVAGIVKLDDAGLYLSRRTGDGAFARVQRRLGAAILGAAPWLMKGLSIAGTAAMFLVGGGILVHGIPPLHHGIEGLAQRLTALPAVGGVSAALAPAALNAVAGVAAGAIVLALVSGVKRLLRPPPTEP